MVALSMDAYWFVFLFFFLVLFLFRLLSRFLNWAFRVFLVFFKRLFLHGGSTLLSGIAEFILLIFAFILQDFSFDFEAIEEFQFTESPHNEVDLLFLMKVYVQTFETWQAFQSADCLLELEKDITTPNSLHRRSCSRSG
jgi:hypothetical protein